MKDLIIFLTIIFLFTTIISCKNENSNRKYYIISFHDSIDNGLRNGTIADTTLSPPPPPIPQSFKWYHDIIFIMDSTDMVFIYQTERKNMDTKLKFLAPLGSVVVKKGESAVNYDTIIYKYNHPYYLGLRPEHLLAIDSKSFISFIQLNNDIFQLDTNDRKSTNIIYIASNKDTITNEAFYQLSDFVNKHNRHENYIHYLVRKTTEEENVVIYFKRNKKDFVPDKIKWTSNFIDGKSQPFTKDYGFIERKTAFLRKAKETYKPGNFKIIPIE